MAAYSLNKLVYQIQFPEGRARFEADPEAFLAPLGLTDEEVDAVRRADIRALWDMGVNPYLLRVFQIWNRISDQDFNGALEGVPYSGSGKGGISRG